MKKHLALLLALTMTVGAALTGCGGSASSSAAASSEAGSSEASSAAAPASAETLVLGTGGTTGTYYAVGGVMQSVLNPKLTLSQLNVTSTGASKANILDVDDGVSQLATVQNDVMYYAANGTDLFESDGKFDTFSTVACLYAETCQIIASADSGIQTVADLKGKTVSVGDAGSGVEFNATQILAAYGIDINSDIKKVNASFGDSADSIKDGKIDAAFVTAGAPTTAVVDLATTKDIVVVPIDDEHAAQLMKDYPFYTKNTIPAGTYNGQDEDVATVAVQATLIASNDVSEDAIYELTKALFDNLDELKTGHPKFGELTLENAIAGASVKLHPGAAKYYTEQGLDVSKLS